MKRVVKLKESLILAGLLIMITLISAPALASQGIINIDKQHGREGDEVTFEVYVANAPNDVYALMLDFRYDSDILEYTGYTKGDLTTDFELFNVGIHEGLLRVGAGKTKSSPTQITQGARGSIVNLSFNVSEECADTTLTLERLLDNIIVNWETEDGSFKCLGSGKKKEKKEKEKKGGGGGASGNKGLSLFGALSNDDSTSSKASDTSYSDEPGYPTQYIREAVENEGREVRDTYNTSTKDRGGNNSGSKDKKTTYAKKELTQVNNTKREMDIFSYQRPQMGYQAPVEVGKEVAMASILPDGGIWISEADRRYERFLLSMILVSLIFLDGVAVFWVAGEYKKRRQTSG